MVQKTINVCYSDTTPEAAKALGRRIRIARLNKGLILDQLIKLVDLGGKSSLSRIEHGEYVPTLPTLEAIAAALDVSVESLLATEPVQDGLSSQEKALINWFRTLSPVRQRATLELFCLIS